MNKGNRRAVLVACSDPLAAEKKPVIAELAAVLAEMGVKTEESRFLYEEKSPQEKAAELNGLFARKDVDFVFDVSGGDLANTVLSGLDFDAIGRSRAVLFGYSDLTAVLNAVYQKTGKASVLYQIRNLVKEDGKRQRERFAGFLEAADWKRNDKNKFPTDTADALCSFPCAFLRGDGMDGVLLGGNIRCFLKLAGTEYLPKLAGRILLLESLGGSLYATRSQLAQLAQLDGFSELAGVVLGTFSRIDHDGGRELLEQAVLKLVPPRIAVARTEWIGHGADACGAWVGISCHASRSAATCSHFVPDLPWFA